MDLALAMPCTATGLALSDTWPLPSCPFEFDPQHCTPPLRNSAQLWLRPAATDMAVLMPVTVTGAALSVVLALPN